MKSIKKIFLGLFVIASLQGINLLEAASIIPKDRKLKEISPKPKTNFLNSLLYPNGLPAASTSVSKPADELVVDPEEADEWSDFQAAPLPVAKQIEFLDFDNVVKVEALLANGSNYADISSRDFINKRKEALEYLVLEL